MPSRDGSHIRWIILILASWIMFGNYYAFDNPSALNRYLRGILAPLDDEILFQWRFGLLYSVYSIPNVCLPLLVGGWLDYFGSRIILIILSILVTCGQLLVTWGVKSNSFAWLLTGRIIFGLGGESLAVAQSRLVTEWFLGRELALAIGMNLSIARIGTVVNNVVSPLVTRYWSVEMAFWLGFITCVMSLICTLAAVGLDKYYRKDRNSEESTPFQGYNSPNLIQFERSFWILTLICFLFFVISYA